MSRRSGQSPDRHEVPDIAPRMLTVQRASEYLSLPVSQIRDLYWSRQLPIIRRGKRIIIDIRDLDAWVEKTKATL